MLPQNRNLDTVTRPTLASRAPVNQRRRAPAPSSRPVRQRRSRSRSWSRSRSRSPIAANDTQNGVDTNLQGLKDVPVSKNEQQVGGGQLETLEEEHHVLTPTEKRIRETAQKEAQLNPNVENITKKSPSGHNPVVDHLIRYETGSIL